MNRYQKRAMLYELSAICRIMRKLIDQKLEGKISGEDFRKKMREIVKHNAALRAKYPREL